MRSAARVRRWCAVLLASLIGLSPALAAQRLGGLEGHYEYREGATLYMVADGDRLVAILGDGKYPLPSTGVDAFVNGVGDPIRFVRDAAGRVVAFTEKGDTFKRLSPDVPEAVRSRLRPRPPGADGRPAIYHYQPPRDAADGIRVGDAGPGTLPREAAERLVRGVIDGTYPDVRSILVYQGGALRLEEYFYGYDRDRPHQMRSLTKSVIALLAGAAVDRGALRADAPVLGTLGYSTYANPDPRKERITLRDLLSNRSGLACNDHDAASPGNERQLTLGEFCRGNSKAFIQQNPAVSFMVLTMDKRMWRGTARWTHLRKDGPERPSYNYTCDLFPTAADWPPERSLRASLRGASPVLPASAPARRAS